MHIVDTEEVCLVEGTISDMLTSILEHLLQSIYSDNLKDIFVLVHESKLQRT